MAEESGNVSHEWTEANIFPVSWEERESLLLNVIDPLVHNTLIGLIDAWFYFWERAPIQRDHLRLRIRWSQPTQANREKLINYLDYAEREKKHAGWYPGSHGIPDELYLGEANEYGEDIWPLVVQSWMSGCELALALVKIDPNNVLTQRRYDNWNRRLHLFSNQLGLSYFLEGFWGLAYAHGYLALSKQVGDTITTDSQTADLIDQIGNAKYELGNTVHRLLAERQTGPSE